MRYQPGKWFAWQRDTGTYRGYVWSRYHRISRLVEWDGIEDGGIILACGTIGNEGMTDDDVRDEPPEGRACRWCLRSKE